MTAPSYREFVAKLKGEADPPDVSARPAERPQPLDATPKGDGAPDAETNLGPKLEKIAGKSLDTADEILDLPLDPDAATFGPTLRAKTAVLGHALTTQVRVDETKLKEKRHSEEKLQEILRIIAEEEAKIRRRHEDRDRYEGQS
jgi:hypothetical protein